MEDQVAVQVSPAGSPLLEWHCPRCRRPQPFASSNAFRANANGKLVDVWLIYRCVACDSTKKLSVAERVPVSGLDPHLLAATETNDAAVVRRYARDMALIRANRVSVAAGERWALIPPSPRLLDRPHRTQVMLEMAEPLLLALRGPLAATLDVTHSGLDRLLARGRVRLQADVSIKTLRLWSVAPFTIESGCEA